MKNIITVEFDENDQAIMNDINSHDGDDRMDVRWSRFFDAGSPHWSEDFDYNIAFLRTTQSYCTELLRARGYLFLNEVSNMLGLPITKYGQFIGWVYNEKNPIGDNYVDFGLDDFDALKEGFNDFGCILLEFNVDGSIIDYI